jgi:hypothetical protein
VVDAREIRESGARDASEARAQIDGLAKIRKGAIANDIALPGLGHDNISVLVDGAPSHGAAPMAWIRPNFTQISPRGSLVEAHQGRLRHQELG